MIRVGIPGCGELRLKHAVFDYNGTLAVDGVLLPGVADGLRGLAGEVTVHVVTADTFGRAAEHLAGLPLSLTVLAEAEQTEAKLDYVSRLGAESVVCFGNGRNDAAMLAAARLGIAVLQGEGCAVRTLVGADIVATSILDALALLRSPQRLVATLRT